MIHRTRKLLACVSLCFALGLAEMSGAAAQPAAFAPASAAELEGNPDAYVGRPIELKDVYCYAVEKGYACMTTQPLSVMVAAIPSSVRKSVIDDGCGELDALEQSPECRFSLRFVPRSVKTETGTYIRGGKAVQGQIKVLTTDTAEPVGGRDR